MLEVIKKTYRIYDEELVESATLTLQCDELEDECEVEVVFKVNGEITMEIGCGADVEDVEVKIDFVTTAIDGNTIYIHEIFDIEGLEEEIKEYLVVTDYDFLSFEGDIESLLENYLIKRNICECEELTLRILN